MIEDNDLISAMIESGQGAITGRSRTWLNSQVARALATARAEAEALRAFVEDVAKQWLPGEPEPFDDFDPCLEDGYRIIVERARALTKGPTQ